MSTPQESTSQSYAKYRLWCVDEIRTALERLNVFDNVGMLEFIANDGKLVHDFTDALLTLAHLSRQRNILVPSFM